MNLVAIAQFFYITYITIMNHLIASSRQDSLLGPIFHHYSIVETNSRGMLHMNYML